MAGRGVYVMRTLRAVRHIARVEWVTVQVRWSQSRAGGEKEEEEVDDEEVAYLEGMRRVMGFGALLVVDMLGGCLLLDLGRHF